MKFNKLIPELAVSSIAESKMFYVEKLGFRVEYERPEDKFVFLSLEGSQLMLEEANGYWETGALQRPFGRGINFQIEVSNPALLAASLEKNEVSLFRELEKVVYSTPNGDEEQVEFLVQDPDGYLLRFCN